MRNLVIIFILLILGSCNDDESTSCNEVICTLDFRSIAVSVRDASSNTIALDSFQVLIKNSNEDITISTTTDELNGYREQGVYPIFNDSFRSRYQNKEETIVFKGILDGQEIVSREFVVGADCCHIGLIEGELLIILGN